MDKLSALSPWITLLLAASCGLIAANIYYAQPLVGPISQSLGLAPEAAGLIVMMTQVGYGIGLLLIVPLGDLFENRRLVVGAVGVSALSLLGAALATHPAPFVVASLLVGLGSVAAQILVPYAAHMAPEHARGRAVGNVMGGLMLGIMSARPVASFLASLASWHAVFYASAAAMMLLAMLLRVALPQRRPHDPGSASHLRFGTLLASMGRLLAETPVLRRRALYQSGLFAAFSLFWTTAPLLLAGPHYGLTQRGIALFALAGVAGAVSAPIAGRVADRGWSRPATGIAMLLAAVSFAMTHLAEPGSGAALALLVAAAILLDFGVQANVVLGQRALFALGAEMRSRLNGLYIATFFAAGAAGSALGAWAYAAGGWALASAIGFAMPVAALLYFATERGQAAGSRRT